MVSSVLLITLELSEMQLDSSPMNKMQFVGKKHPTTTRQVVVVC